MAMLKRLNSRFDNDSVNRFVEPEKVYKTWQQILDDFKIEPILIAWNTDGMNALRILREKYGHRFGMLHNSMLDEIVQKFKGRGVQEQLEALGTAVKKFDLYLCCFQINREEYYYYIEKIDRIEELLKLNELYSLFRIKHKLCKIIALNDDNLLETPLNDIQIPISSIQLKKSGSYYDNPYTLEHFLIAPYKTLTENYLGEITQLRVYDLRYWPLHELKHELIYNSANIEPYTLMIESESGEKYCYVGDGTNSPLCWNKTFLSETGDYLPLYDDREARFHHGRLKKLPKIGNNSIEMSDEIPTINEAEPLMLVDNRIIYHYKNDDIEHRKPEKVNPTPTMRFLEHCEQRKNRITLLEYNPETKKFRKMELPGVGYLCNLMVYKNTWFVLPYNKGSRSGTSYLLRLWNPRTNECLRLTSQNMGEHEIDNIYQIPNGDIIFLLDDGRLCHMDVDLISWLRKDIQMHNVMLESWQDECRRSYENFPVLSERRQHLRPEDADDRMLITFEDGKIYDVMIRENKK